MTHIFHYDTTFETEDAEGNVKASIECRIEYTFQPGVEAQISGPPEGCYPAEAPEIEVSGIREETWVHGLGKAAVYEWVKIKNPEIYAILADWAITSLFDSLCESAAEDMEGREDAAREQAYESRRELDDLSAADDRLTREGDE